MRFARIYLVIIGLILLSASGAICQGRTVSADTLPREHWSYDAMAYLAAQGLAVGQTARFYQGDFLLDELEMAERVRDILANSELLSQIQGRNRNLLSRLAQEFREQLILLGVSSEEIDLLQSESNLSAVLTGYVGPLLRFSDGKKSIFGTYEADVLVPFRKHGLITATLSTADREYRENPEAFPKIDKFNARGFGKDWEWEIGKNSLFWGSGYSGSMILSDNPPPFDFARVTKDFNLGGHIGRVQLTQIIAPFEDSDKHFWFLGRRLQKTFSPHFNLGINETVKTGERPRPLVLIMPALYLYQYMFLNDLDQEWNELVSIDASYRTKGGREYYTELIIDDITSPQPFGTVAERPRKTGLLIGAHAPKVDAAGRTSVRAEVIIVDPETYLSTREDFPEVNYLKNGYFIGHPVGNDAEALFLRVTHKPGGGIMLVGEYLAARKKTTGVKERAANFLAIYNVNERLSTSIRWREFLGSPKDRLELTGSYAF